MTTITRNGRIQVLLDRHGRTFAEEAGITLRDQPSPLYRLLVLCVLLSAPIASATATAAARALATAGLRTPRAMLDSSSHQRVEVLRSAGYRRFDERTVTMLGDGAQLLADRWGGDLRRLHAEADGDVGRLRRLLQDVPGIGPVGSAIFCREVQGVWDDVGHFLDDRVRDGARALSLPSSPSALARLVARPDVPRLAAACVRATLDDAVVSDVKAAGAAAQPAARRG